MKTSFVCLFALIILSGCRQQHEGALHQEVKVPNIAPEISLGRVGQLPEFDNQLLVEVIVVNKGKTPVALDMNRFYIDCISSNSGETPWPSWGYFGSPGETCLLTFSANSSNRIMLVTSYFELSTPPKPDWGEWGAGDYNFGLFYAPPVRSSVDYLWAIKRIERNQTSIRVDTRDVHFSNRLRSPRLTLDEWQKGRTNDPPWEVWRKERAKDPRGIWYSL